jgi:hypothetical protein
MIRRSDRGRVRCAIAACAAVLGLWVAGSADGAVGAVTFQAPGHALAGLPVTFTGHVRQGEGRLVAIERLTSRGWRVLLRGYSARGGRFLLFWTAPSHPGSVVLRAVVFGSSGVRALSDVRTVRVRAGQAVTFQRPGT